MDANALMMPVECNVRVFEELDRLLADVSTTTGPGDTDAVTGTDDAAGANDAAGGAGQDLAVPRAVVAELERLAAGAGEAATAAAVGLDLAREHCRVTDHEADSGDAAVFECATRETATHAVTNDGPLRERLLDAGVPVISLRGRNKLAVTQP